MSLFPLILFVLLVITGILWFADRIWLKKQRSKSDRDPWWVEYGAGFFPVILIVFVLRSFVVEPFRIPSGSMIPTLLVGDFILVNKYTYGIRLPIINTKVIDVGSPERGDVMVFRYPEDPSQDYIKRVVGLPGDKVAYQNKQLTINDKPVALTPKDDFLHPERLTYSAQFDEALGNKTHRILNYRDIPSYVHEPSRFPGRENCTYNTAGVVCHIPEGHYFVMGDNRDDSRDSRSWGFVPEGNIVGKAFFIWLNFSDLGRIGFIE